MTSAVMTSPVRISLRVRLSSKSAAKVSWGAGVEDAAGIAFDIEKSYCFCPSNRTGFVDPQQKAKSFCLGSMSPVRPAVPARDQGRRLPGAHRRCVEQPRSGALLERRRAACRIACVALAQILQKGGQCSSDSFFFQLFIPAFGAGLGARG